MDVWWKTINYSKGRVGAFELYQYWKWKSCQFLPMYSSNTLCKRLIFLQVEITLLCNLKSQSDSNDFQILFIFYTLRHVTLIKFFFLLFDHYFISSGRLNRGVNLSMKSSRRKVTKHFRNVSLIKCIFFENYSNIMLPASVIL